MSDRSYIAYTSSGHRGSGYEMHWGVRVDLDKPTTGVCSANAPEWLDDDLMDGVDLAWEEHVESCEGRCAHEGCRCNHEDAKSHVGEAFRLVAEDERPVEECGCWRAGPHVYDPRDDHDGCGPEERGTVLAGSWKKDPETGKWEPDESGDYAAIVGEIYVQVVWSKTVVRCKSLCSPCFPGQADLDSVVSGDEGYLTYDLPAEVWGDESEHVRALRGEAEEDE